MTRIPFHKAACRIRLALLVAAALLVPSSASADSDAEIGRQIAEENCGQCHALDPTGASPLADAPPFRSFAARWPLENLEEAFAEGIMVGHVMPEFTFTPEEIGHMIAYLNAVAEAAAAEN